VSSTKSESLTSGALPVCHVALTCGFDGMEEAERYVAEEVHKEEQRAFWKADPESARYWYPTPPHKHAYSSVGRCMWRGCTAKKESG
jgi:hypothetical protein